MALIYLPAAYQVRVALRPASLGPRAVALGIDLLAIWLAMMAATSLYFQFVSSEVGEWAFVLLIYLPITLSIPLCEALSGGQTLGKRLMGLRTVSISGGPLTAGQAALRFLLLMVDGLAGFSLGAVMIVVTKRSQRLGDLAAGTTVISLRGLMRKVPDQGIVTAERPDYVPRYPLAAELSRRQAEIITRLVYAPPGSQRDAHLLSLSRKVQAVCGPPHPADPTPESYLCTVLADWRHYRLEAGAEELSTAPLDI